MKTLTRPFNSAIVLRQVLSSVDFVRNLSKMIEELKTTDTGQKYVLNYAFLPLDNPNIILQESCITIWDGES